MKNRILQSLFLRFNVIALFFCMVSNAHTQNSIERKWGIQLSPNQYFRQSIEMPKKDNAFVTSRNGVSGSAYIFRNFNIKKAPRLSFTAMMGINVYPLLDVIVGYNKDFRPSIALIEIDQIILQDREVIYPDAWCQFNYEIFNNTQINSAIGLGLLPIQALYTNHLRLRNEKYGDYIYFYLNSEFNPLPITFNYKFGFTREIKLKRFKINLTPAYVRSLNPFLIGDVFLLEDINTYRSESFKTYLNYFEISVGIVLMKKKKILI